LRRFLTSNNIVKFQNKVQEKNKQSLFGRKKRSCFNYSTIVLTKTQNFMCNAMLKFLTPTVREGVLCGMRNAEIWKSVFCGFLSSKRSANYTLRAFPYFAYRKIQIKSNNQLRLGLGLQFESRINLTLETPSVNSQA